MFYRTAIAVAILVGISACNDKATETISEEKTTPTAVTLSGVILAPSGNTDSLSRPTFAARLTDVIVGKKLVAATTGWTSVGEGVEVSLIEINDAGDVVSTIATATSDAEGSYSLELPEEFTPGAKYVVRAGTGTTYIESRVPVASGALDIDPASHAASGMVDEILSAWESSLSDLKVEELEIILDETNDILESIDFTEISENSIAGVSAEIKNSLKNDEDKANVLFSAGAKGKICGKVTDTNEQAVDGIRIIARDFGNWVTRAKAKTDSEGNYCINVPKAGDTDPYTNKTVSGKYILGAVNRSTDNMIASQWWTSSSENADGSGGANNQYSAEMISVASDSSGETANFVLDANGARISGTVSTHDSGNPEGVRVLIREYDTFKPLASAKVSADGTYAINVKATSQGYGVVFRNRSLKPYASEYYPDKHQRNLAQRVAVAAGEVSTIDANLEAGAMIRGRVFTDSTKSTPSTGERVSIQHPDYAGTVDRLRTNKEGRYRYWTVPGTYAVDSRGQSRDVTIVEGANDPIVFSADVASISGKLVATNAAGEADTSIAVSELFVRVNPIDSSSGLVKGYVNWDSANADGSFEVYVDGYVQDGTATPTTVVSGYVLYARADSQESYGSGVYNDSDAFDKTTFGAAKNAPITVDAAGKQTLDLGTIKVPTAGDSNGGVGYLVGDAGMPAVAVKVGIGGIGNGKQFMSSASRGDNSIRITLPVGTYYVFRHVYESDSRTVAQGNGAICSTVEISSGKTTTVTFGAQSSATCSASAPE